MYFTKKISSPKMGGKHTQNSKQEATNNVKTKLAKIMKRKRATADARDKEILLSQNCAGETGGTPSDADARSL